LEHPHLAYGGSIGLRRNTYRTGTFCSAGYQFHAKLDSNRPRDFSENIIHSETSNATLLECHANSRWASPSDLAGMLFAIVPDKEIKIRRNSHRASNFETDASSRQIPNSTVDAATMIEGNLCRFK
jgi:hypothetical protein